MTIQAKPNFKPGDRSVVTPQNHRIATEKLIALASVVTGLLIWWLVTSLRWVDPLFLPSPTSVWAAFLEILRDGYKGSSLLFHIYASMYRLGIALALALITAIPLGMICGLSDYARAALDPWIEFYRPLPPLAYYTLLVIWLGIEDGSKIALLYLAAFAPLFISIVSGVQRIPQDRMNGARSLGASGWQILFYVVLPSILPELFTGLRTAIGVAYSTLVAAEMVAAISGVGWMVLDASKFLRSDVIFVGIIIMGIIAVLIDASIRWIQKIQVPWIGHES
ncbi:MULTISPECIES: ABC transporter permease subunit [unclassified Leptolyngbya]|uniref:ABC transporter permease n=1 Tax=unclassified Leptolyngbya TaxID=2650499 RepID=UPI001687154F|nr:MULTISPECIES: ABC transporter permease subunit [unclassified Leptolyngbya]MBD1909180.1 ABC transporter permease subunit [Leptolyngbya sp. FACHB-8]MBD2158439.1 ABC transporter permease subunit [Leptolyngbya sp. FACHB-16]